MSYKRQLRRLRNLSTIWWRTRDPHLTLAAARTRSIYHVATFLEAGGRLSRGLAEWHGQSFRIPTGHMDSLPLAAELMQVGAGIDFGPEGCCVSLANGLTFEFPDDYVAESLLILRHRFLEEEYAQLQVRGAVVVDIGAYIGDSALYFLSRGAAEVVSYEPFEMTFGIARGNVIRNGAEQKVRLVQAGVSSSPGEADVPFDPSQGTAMTTVTDPVAAQLEHYGREGEVGRERVRLVAFTEVLRQASELAGARPLVCKVDCEGAEFEIFLEAPLPPQMAAVAQVFIETHHRSPEPIERVLEAAGYRVEQMPVTDPALHKLLATRV